MVYKKIHTEMMYKENYFRYLYTYYMVKMYLYYFQLNDIPDQLKLNEIPN